MVSFFSKPYPRDYSFRRLLTASASIGLFIGLFLIIFEPFNAGAIEGRSFRIAFLGGYGILTMIAGILIGLAYRFLFPEWIDEKRWTTGKEIFTVTVNILIISLLNMFYTNFVFHHTFELLQIPYWAFITLIVSIIPVSFNVVLRQAKMSRESEGMAKVMNEEIVHRKEEIAMPVNSEIPAWIFTSESEKEKFGTNEQTLLFIESTDNYSTFYFLEDGGIKKQMLRGSLKKMEEQVRSSLLYRCHRSYIVNLAKVISVSGNAQGYRLHFKATDLAVPVSRNLGKELKEKLA